MTALFSEDSETFSTAQLYMVLVLVLLVSELSGGTTLRHTTVGTGACPSTAPSTIDIVKLLGGGRHVSSVVNAPWIFRRGSVM